PDGRVARARVAHRRARRVRGCVRPGLRCRGVPARHRWEGCIPARAAAATRRGTGGGRVKLERVELFVVRLPLKRAYETSGSRETHQTRVICRAQAEGIAGWGESVAPEQPWYSGETPKTVWYALEEYIVPQLFRADLKTPEDTSRALGWIREHRMAKATIETAIWDLFAKREAKPLSAMLGGTRARILCGVAIGIQPSLEALFETIARELESGYQRVKLKIKPGWDAKVAEAVRNAYPALAF